MAIDLDNTGRTIHVGVVLMNSETEILDVAPIDLLNGMSFDFIKDLPLPPPIKAKALDVAFHWVSETGKPVRLTAGITLQCTDSFETCPRLDIVLMGARQIGYVESEGEIAFMRKAFDECSAFLTICGGFESACRAGLLENKTATAPKFLLDGLRQEHPETNWIEKRWARDGKLWTSGALLNGLDMMMAFARETWPSKADMVNILLEIGGWPTRDSDYSKEN